MYTKKYQDFIKIDAREKGEVKTVVPRMVPGELLCALPSIIMRNLVDLSS